MSYSFVQVPCNGVTLKGRQCRRLLYWRTDDLPNAYCGTHRPREAGKWLIGGVRMPALTADSIKAALARHPASQSPRPKLRLIRGGRYGE